MVEAPIGQKDPMSHMDGREGGGVDGLGGAVKMIVLTCSLYPLWVFAEGGITKKVLFQKARAELNLQNTAAVEETMALAAEHGLSTAVKEMLQRRNLSAT